MRKQRCARYGEDCLNIIDKSPWVTIGMINTESSSVPEAYCLPMSFVREGDYIFLHTAHQGLKVDCLAKNSRVSLLFVGSSETVPDKYTVAFESVIAKGNVSYIENDEEKVRILTLLSQRYCPNHMAGVPVEIASGLKATSILSIKIEDMIGKQSPYNWKF